MEIKELSEMQEIRLENLMKLISSYGTQELLADKLDITPGQISQLVRRRRGMGENQAKGIERKLNLPEGWLSQEHESDDIEHNIVKKEQRIEASSEIDVVAKDLIIEWIRSIEEKAGVSLSRVKRLKLAKILYRHYRTHGKPSESQIIDLINLSN